MWLASASARCWCAFFGPAGLSVSHNLRRFGSLSLASVLRAARSPPRLWVPRASQHGRLHRSDALPVGTLGTVDHAVHIAPMWSRVTSSLTSAQTWATTSLLATHLVGEKGQVVAVEAAPGLSNALARSVTANRLRDIFIEHIAVAAWVTTVGIQHEQRGTHENSECRRPRCRASNHIERHCLRARHRRSHSPDQDRHRGRRAERSQRDSRVAILTVASGGHRRGGHTVGVDRT